MDVTRKSRFMIMVITWLFSKEKLSGWPKFKIIQESPWMITENCDFQLYIAVTFRLPLL
jgi:hypothetical protein